MPKWLEINNKAESEPVEILIYDQIGKDWYDGSGVQAKEFAMALSEIPKDREIVVAINSPGGNVWDGLAIYQQLKARGEKVTTRVDGLAASIASIIALAGHEVQIPENALFMIHDPSGICMGTASEMETMAAELDKHADVLASIYAEKTGDSPEDMRALMRAETWMTGAEAQSSGFADTVTDEISLSASSSKRGWRDRFTPQGRALKPKPQTEHKMENKTPEPKAPVEPKVDRNADKITALEAQLKAERTARITARLDNVIDNNPSLDREEWLPVVIENESVLDNLSKIEAPQAGIAPIENRIEVKGSPLVEKYEAMAPGAEREKFAIQNHAQLQSAERDILAKRQAAPRAANTMAAGLVTDYLSNALVVVAHNKLSALKAFSTDFGTDPMKPRATVQVPKATAGATAQTNPSNYESGDSTLGAISVSVSEKSLSFHVTSTQMQQGYKLAQLAKINANGFCNSISDVWTALLTSGNFGSAITIGTAANFDADDLKPIMAAAKDYEQKHVVLDGGHLAYLLPTDKDKFRVGEAGAYGFDGIFEQNRWTSAQTNTAGIVCGPAGLAVASGLPLNTRETSTRRVGSVQLEDLGLTVATNQWESDATREQWASYDVMFGAALGETNQINVLITA